MNNRTEIRTAMVVGCGSMGRRRIRHLLELTDAEIIGWDIRADRRREVEELFGIRTLSTQLEAESLGPDAMFISVPPAEHFGYLDLAISKAIPFMVEQPIVSTLESTERLLDGIRNAAVPAHVSCNHRFSGRVKAIAEIMASGRLGRLLTGIVEIGEYLPDWHTYEPYTDYYPSKRSMGGGLDAVCDLDWMRCLFGEVTDAVSMQDKISDLEIDTDDVAQFVFRFETGAQFVLHTDMLQRQYTGAVKLVFSEGTLVHQMPDRHLRIYSGTSGGWEELAFDEPVEKFTSMQGKSDFHFVEPMYFLDTADFIERHRTGNVDTDSVENGIRNLSLVYSLINGVKCPSPW